MLSKPTSGVALKPYNVARKKKKKKKKKDERPFVWEKRKLSRRKGAKFLKGPTVLDDDHTPQSTERPPSRE